MSNINTKTGTRFSDGLIVGGDFHADGNLYLNDHTVSSGPNSEAQGSIYLGTGGDLRITTSNDSGVIRQTTAAKDLFIQPANNQSIKITDIGTNENIAVFTDNGPVELYHGMGTGEDTSDGGNGSTDAQLKFSTTTTGATIVGDLLLKDDSIAGGDGTLNYGTIGSPSTANLGAGEVYEITATGASTDWSNLLGEYYNPVAIGQQFTYRTGGTQTGDQFAGANSTARVKRVGFSRITFPTASSTGDGAYIQTIRQNTNGTRMQFYLNDDARNLASDLSQTDGISLTSLKSYGGEVFEWKIGVHPATPNDTDVPVMYLVPGRKDSGDSITYQNELVMAGDKSRVVADFFVGQAKYVSELKSASGTAFTTDDLAEGSSADKKYFSNTLAHGAFSAGTGGINFSTADQNGVVAINVGAEVNQTSFRGARAQSISATDIANETNLINRANQNLLVLGGVNRSTTGVFNPTHDPVTNALMAYTDIKVGDHVNTHPSSALFRPGTDDRHFAPDTVVAEVNVGGDANVIRLSKNLIADIYLQGNIQTFVSFSRPGISTFDQKDFITEPTTGHVRLRGVDGGSLSDASVELSKIKNIAKTTLIGNSSTSAAAAPAALSALDARALLNVADGADNYGSWSIHDGTNEKDIAAGKKLTIEMSNKGTAALTDDGATGDKKLTLNIPDNDTQYTAKGTNSSDFDGIYKQGNEFVLSNNIRPTSTLSVGSSDNVNGAFAKFDSSGNTFFYQNTTTLAGKFETRSVSDIDNGTDKGLLVAGNITAYSSALSSDIKLKQDIVVVDDALEVLSKIDGVRFNWKDSGKASSGVIAQNIEEVLPELVRETETLNSDNDTHKVVDYNGLSAYFIEAIKELKEQNDLLRAEIEELKANK